MKTSAFLNKLVGGSDRFQRNFLSLAGANALAHLIQILALPLLTRVFSPADFGALAVFTAAQSIAISVATGRFDWSIPNAKSARMAAALIGVGLCILAVSMLTLVLVLIFFGFEIASLIGLPAKNANLIYLMPVGLLGGGLQLIFQTWFVYRARLSVVSRSKLLQNLSNVMLNLLAMLTTLGAMALVVSYIAGIWVAVGVLIRRESRLWRLLRATSISQIKRAFKEFHKEAAASVLTGLVNTLTHANMTFLIAFNYDQTVVGWYALVYRIGTAPIGFLTAAMAQSFWAEAAPLVKKDPKKLHQFYLSTMRRLAILAAVMAPVFLAGPHYVGWIFGEEKWAGAGILLAAITPYLIGIIIFGPTTHLIVYGKQHWQLLCDVFTLAANVCTFIILAKLGYEPWFAIMISSLVLLLGYLLRCFAHFKANSLLVAKMEKGRIR